MRQTLYFYYNSVMAWGRWENSKAFPPKPRQEGDEKKTIKVNYLDDLDGYMQ